MKHARTLALCFLVALLVVEPARAQDLQSLVADSEGHRRLGNVARLAPAAAPSRLEPASPADTLAARDSTVAAAFDALVRPQETRIIVVSKDREIIYERYAENWLRKSTPLGYSMSKSLTALAVGKAKCGGHVPSLQARGADVLPALAGTSWGDATIEQILRMQSGSSIQGPPYLGWQTEQVAAENRGIYTGRQAGDYLDLMRRHDERKLKPGQEFQYNNYDTLALGLLVEAATKRRFHDFFNEAVWQPAGPAQTGAWLLNSNGQTGAFAGFSAAPEDWIRLGHYVIESMGKGDCFARYLADAVKPAQRTFISSRCYGYQVWNWCRADNFMFFGYRGQYLVMNPGRGVVMYAHQGAGTNDAKLMAAYQQVLAVY